MYTRAHLSDSERISEDQVTAELADPIAQFHAWMAEAEKSEPNDANAMALATADAAGQPRVRMVLLKGVDADGFVFYTNLESRKGADLAANPQRGAAVPLEVAASARCASRVRSSRSTVPRRTRISRRRPRGSRIGAWASRQSRPLAVALRAGEARRRVRRASSASARSRGRISGPASG